MSMGNSGLFKGTAGALADEGNAPIGFDETPPESAEDAPAASHSHDTTPRTVRPPMTNGGMLRSLDNRQLAQFLANTDMNDFWDLCDNADAWFDRLNQSCQMDCFKSLFSSGGAHEEIPRPD